MKIGRGVPTIGPRTDRQIYRRTDTQTDKTRRHAHHNTLLPTGGEKTKNCRNVFCVRYPYIGSINGGQQAESETMNADNLWIIDKLIDKPLYKWTKCKLHYSTQ